MHQRLFIRVNVCLVVQRQWQWIRGGPRYWGRACRQKGPARATRNFSGNGVAVEAMCADRHEYRPVAANEGGIPKAIHPSKCLPPHSHMRSHSSSTVRPEKRTTAMCSACPRSRFNVTAYPTNSGWSSANAPSQSRS